MQQDKDPAETREWLDALEAVIRHEGPERAAYLLGQLAKVAVANRTQLPTAITTPFRNTIPPTDEKRMPGDLSMERRVPATTKEEIESSTSICFISLCIEPQSEGPRRYTARLYYYRR